MNATGYIGDAKTTGTSKWYSYDRYSDSGAAQKWDYGNICGSGLSERTVSNIRAGI